MWLTSPAVERPPAFAFRRRRRVPRMPASSPLGISSRSSPRRQPAGSRRSGADSRSLVAEAGLVHASQLRHPPPIDLGSRVDQRAAPGDGEGPLQLGLLALGPLSARPSAPYRRVVVVISSTSFPCGARSAQARLSSRPTVAFSPAHRSPRGGIPGRRLEHSGAIRPRPSVTRGPAPPGSIRFEAVVASALVARRGTAEEVSADLELNAPQTPPWRARYHEAWPCRSQMAVSLGSGRVSRAPSRPARLTPSQVPG